MRFVRVKAAVGVVTSCPCADVAASVVAAVRKVDLGEMQPYVAAMARCAKLLGLNVGAAGSAFCTSCTHLQRASCAGH